MFRQDLLLRLRRKVKEDATYGSYRSLLEALFKAASQDRIKILAEELRNNLSELLGY